jgi:uncharacterized membrane protein (DUF2068 family)
VTKITEEVGRLVKDEVKRPDFGLRVIIIWKCIKGCLLLLVAITAFALMHSDLHAIGTSVVEWLGIDAARPRVDHFLAELTGMTPTRIASVGVGAIVVAGVMFVEAWGLHRRRVWAEWLTVIVTASLIPLEIYHLVKHPSVGKVLTLIGNIAIVIYLMRHRWLFGPGRIGRWWRRRQERRRRLDAK